MTRDVVIVLAILNLLATIGYVIRSLGDLVVLGVVLFYSLAVSFVLAGLFLIVVLLARWWTTPCAPRRRRSFWS